MATGKGEQLLGLLLEETEQHVVLGFPARCYMQELEDGGVAFEAVPYTKLPYLTVQKTTPFIKVPIHAESEYFYYEYVANNIVDDKDFSSLMGRYGFDPVLSQEYYLNRHVEVEPYCDLLSDEEVIIEDVSSEGEKVIH